MPTQNVSLTQLGSGSDMDAINRRMRLAEQLQAQSLQPIQSSRPDSPISWTQGLAQMLKAHYARQGMNQAEAERRSLVERQEQRQGADASLLAQALMGRQAQPQGLTEDASGNVTQRDAIPGQTPVQSLGQAIPMMGPQMQGPALNLMAAAQQRQDQQQFQREQLGIKRDELVEGRKFRETEAEKQRQLQRELVQMRADVGGDRPFYQFLQTPEGYVAGNARSGTVSPVLNNGKPVMPAQASPQLQGQLAEAKAGGKERGEASALAQIDLPRVADNASNALSLIDQMIGSEDGKTKAHPGFQSYVGATLTPGLRFIEGTDTANFEQLLNQSKGGAFLEAFNSLKGGGQITEVEGKKATDAITRMNKAQSEKEFVKAAREYQGIIQKGVERAKMKAGGYGGPDRRGVPQGIEPALWEVMTPKERALWSR